VVAILSIGDDEVEVLKHLFMPMAAQLFDLFYAHPNVCLLAECPPDGNRRPPTATWLGHPGQHRVWMTDHDRPTVDCGRGTEDILPISQDPRCWMRPSCTIQGKQLGTSRRELLDEVPLQPFPVLPSPLNGGVTTVPLTAEDRKQSQLGKGADRLTEKQGIDELELSVTGFGESVFVDSLTKLD
jgi:hypothetical protein